MRVQRVIACCWLGVVVTVTGGCGAEVVRPPGGQGPTVGDYGRGAPPGPLQGDAVVTVEVDEAEQVCRQNLRRIYRGMSRMIHRSGDTWGYGDIDDRAILSYMGGELRCPNDPNQGRELSYVLPWSSILGYSGNLLAYEAGPFHDGKALALFRDGTVRALTWEELQSRLGKKRRDEEQERSH